MNKSIRVPGMGRKNPFLQVWIRYQIFLYLHSHKQKRYRGKITSGYN